MPGAGRGAAGSRHSLTKLVADPGQELERSASPLINTSRSTAHEPRLRKETRTALGCNQGPSGSGWPGWSASQHLRWPSSNLAAPAGSRMRLSLDWKRLDSSHSHGSRAIPGNRTDPAPSRSSRACRSRSAVVSRTAAVTSLRLRNPTSWTNPTRPAEPPAPAGRPAHERSAARPHAPLRPAARPPCAPSRP